MTGPPTIRIPLTAKQVQRLRALNGAVVQANSNYEVALGMVLDGASAVPAVVVGLTVDDDALVVIGADPSPI